MNPFSLLIKPASADCNLRCRYCFYIEKCKLYPQSAVHRMSDEVLQRMISTFLATDQPQYGFGWQGGEPTLMGLDFFKKVISLQQEFGRPGSQVSNGLQTNGTLIDNEFAKHLAAHNFLVGVSLDGPAQLHNCYRKFADGRGAHTAVMQGLAALQRQKVEYNILTLVSRANVHRPLNVYHYLCEMGVRYHQYIECVEFDPNGQLMPFAINGLEWGDFLCAIYDAWVRKDTRRVSIRLFDSILAMMVDGAATCCPMGRDCRQYLVVEHNGDVYPCDFYVEPELKLGNIMDVTWAELLNSPIYEKFGARKSQWNETCETCPYLTWCAGCCQKNRPTRGKEPGRLSVLCEGWKLFYEHAMPGFERLSQEIRAERQAGRDPSVVAGETAVNAASPAGGTGRNESCPCGSGRKFKKCCGRRGLAA